MRHSQLLAVFESDQAILAAARACKDSGFPAADAYTPFPVHGLDEAMGIRPTRLPIVCFLLGLCGVIAAFTLQIWTFAVDWPVNVGGKSHVAFPALVPIAFEVMVLFACIGTTFAFFARSRLWPGKKPVLVAGGVTNDRFALVVDVPAEKVEYARRALGDLGATFAGDSGEIER